MVLPGRRIAKRMIASNLDLIPIIFPEEYGSLGRSTPEKHLTEYQRVANIADAFISISEFSKSELHSKIKIPLEKIKVIYLAGDEAFFRESKTPTGPKYIFTIGGSEPRKNVQTIIDAYMKLPAQIQNDYQLLIAGSEWHGKHLNDYGNKNIIQLGFVSDDDLPRLYRNASIFVFASIYEGFGFAILEAMASQTPVIRAHGSSLDEVSGDATIPFDPQNTQSLVEKIIAILSDKKIQGDLIAKGNKQAVKFSWKKSAKELHKVLTEEIKE